MSHDWADVVDRLAAYERAHPYRHPYCGARFSTEDEVIAHIACCPDVAACRAVRRRDNVHAQTARADQVRAAVSNAEGGRDA